jgi:hypothetical protein
VAGDITRTTFDPLKHYSAVRQQQGRVSVDADWNEQADIVAYRARTDTADVLGRTGAPRDNAGFQVIPLPLAVPPSPQPNSVDLALAPGRMYVDGILCELEATLVPVTITKTPGGTVQVQLTNMVLDGRELAPGQWIEVSATDNTAPNALVTQIQTVTVSALTLTVNSDISNFLNKSGQHVRRITTYVTQADSPSPAAPPSNGLALAYLDVWERTITAVEDGEIRDPALGPSNGADTTTRTKTVWQVKLQAGMAANTTCATAPDFTSFTPQSTGQLAARAEPTGAPSACILPPQAGFRRLENQLYRVEVQTPGSLATGKPTFKWSRDNGSIVSAITAPAPVPSGKTLTVNVPSLGRDLVLGFAPGQFVELTDDGRELGGLPGILVKVASIAQESQGPVLTVDTSLSNAADLSSFLNAFTNNTIRNPKVRRWDQSGTQVSTAVPGGDVLIQEGVWFPLESGVQVFFQPGGNYVTGDYWLVPARTVTGDVDWPRDSAGNPQFRQAQGIRHHYCRLGIVNFGPATQTASPWSVTGDCRQLFAPAADSGIHITQVVLTNPNPTEPILNDAPVLLQDLTSGITIICDLPIDPVSLVNPSPSFATGPLSKPSCFVTVNIPTAAAGGHAVQPMIVQANLTLDGTGTIIFWTPTSDAITGLTQVFSQAPPPSPLLAHLTLRGNYIWALGNPSLFLDGETFGGPDPSGNQRTSLLLPSGDGRRGGDFEMWFWLTSPPTGVVVVSPASLDFGNQAVNAATTLPVLVTNNTAGPVTLSITLAGGDFSETVTPSATLAAGASSTINVTFTPTQPGLRTGTMTVTPPGATVTLTGIGLGATLQPAPPAVSFLATIIGDAADQTLTLTNVGSAPLTISSVTIGGAAGGDYSASPSLAGTVLGPGASSDLDVTFSPTRVGGRNASITIVHTGTNSPLVVPLSGTGRVIKTGGGGGGGIIGGGGGHLPQLKVILQ